jgi:ATP-binding cassette subfamily C protein CydD/ATP-binding cassette subfamily C protein CydCD
MGAWRSRIAYLAQRPFFPERATVREAIRLLVPEATDDAMANALEQVGVLRALREHRVPLDVRVATLSVGQRQRIALARVLVKDAPIVVLDEPDANLDAAGIRTTLGIVTELARTKMVAIAAHTDEFVRLDATHVALLDPGRPELPSFEDREARELKSPSDRRPAQARDLSVLRREGTGR